MDKEVNYKEDRKNNGFHWLLWWLIDDEELNHQVNQYNQLKITQSARGWSILLLLLSGIVTTLLIVFGDWGYGAFLDISLFLILSFFIYKGHKWAMICAMLLWTFEKFFMFFDNYQAASSSGTSTPNVIISLIWWSTYMHVFYLAFKTEKKRNKETKKNNEELKPEKEYIWTCDFCNKEFNSKLEADEHEKKCELNSKKIKTKIYCTNCGSENSIDANFCIKCGNKIII